MPPFGLYGIHVQTMPCIPSHPLQMEGLDSQIAGQTAVRAIYRPALAVRSSFSHIQTGVKAAGHKKRSVPRSGHTDPNGQKNRYDGFGFGENRRALVEISPKDRTKDLKY